MYKQLRGKQDDQKEWPTELSLKISLGHATSLSLSHHHAYICLGMLNGSLYILAFPTLSVIRVYQHQLLEIIGTHWSPTGDQIISVSKDWTICVWSTLKHELETVYELDFLPEKVSFCPSKFGLLIVQNPNKTLLLNIFTGESEELFVEESNCVLFIDSELICIGTELGTLHFFSISKKQVLKTLQISSRPLISINYCEYAKELAISCGDKSVGLVFMADVDSLDDLNSLMVSCKLVDSSEPSNCDEILLSRSGEYLFAFTRNSFLVWNTFGQIIIDDLFIGITVKSVVFDDSRVWLACISSEGTVYVYKTNPPKKWSSLIPHFEGISKTEYFEEGNDAFDIKPYFQGDTSKYVELIEPQYKEPTDVVIPLDF